VVAASNLRQVRRVTLNMCQPYSGDSNAKTKATMCDNYNRKLCHKQQPGHAHHGWPTFWPGPPTWPQKKQAQTTTTATTTETTTTPTTTQLSK